MGGVKGRHRAGKSETSSLSLGMSTMPVGPEKESFMRQIIQSKKSPVRTGTASGLNRATSSAHPGGLPGPQVDVA